MITLALLVVAIVAFVVWWVSRPPSLPGRPDETTTTGRDLSPQETSRDLDPDNAIGVVNAWMDWITMTSLSFNKGFPITPSDTVDLPLCGSRCRAIYIGSGGDVAAVYVDGTVSILPAITGQILPISVRRVNLTGTTASKLTALYQV